MSGPTLGERNRNPFNLRFSPKILWLGLDDPPQDEHGFCRFISDALGLRAGFRDLRTACCLDRCDTWRKLIARFAPTNENNTDSYIADVVCRFFALDPAAPPPRIEERANAPIDLADPDQLKRGGLAVIHHEQGRVSYPDSAIAAAVAAALR
jgi:hypothetical protein